MKKVLTFGMSLIIVFGMVSCEEEEKDDETTTMCYEVNNGILTVNCSQTGVSTSAENGRSDLAT